MISPESSDVRRVGVIGGGIVGLAVCWSLRRRGIGFDLFEYAAPGGGQSGGESRIFRHAHDDPRLIEMAARSRRLWRDWESEFEVQLISSDGVVALGESAVSQLQLIRETAPEIDAYEVAASQLRELLPALAGHDGPAVFDADGGAIRTRLAIASLIERVGTELIPVRVEAVEILESGLAAVRSAGIRRVYDTVIVCAGVDTERLAALNEIPIPVETETRIRITYPISSGPVSGLASIRDRSGMFGEQAVYGSPLRGNKRYAVGLAETSPLGDGGLVLWDRVDGLTARTNQWVARAMPGLNPEVGTGFNCWATRLPWSPDGFGIWQKGPVFHLGGDNLFKMAPLLGEILADTVSTGEVPEDLRPGNRLGSPAATSKSPSR